MALFTITIGSYSNLPPNSIGDNIISLTHNETYIFTLNDFTVNTTPSYSDPEGDTVEAIKILTLPSTGTLYLDVTPVIALDEIPVASISGGLLNYIADIGTTTLYSEDFTFDISDIGSSTFSGLTGTMTLNVAAKENEPPSAVGNGETTIDYGETLIFTRTMLTSALTPAYSDPEGDAAGQLKVLTLPTLGTLRLNGVDVLVNDNINFTDIDSGLLIYIPDLADTDGDIQGFTFQIADIGSGQFIG